MSSFHTKKPDRQIDNETKERKEMTELKEIESLPVAFLKISGCPLGAHCLALQAIAQTKSWQSVAILSILPRHI